MAFQRPFKLPVIDNHRPVLLNNNQLCLPTILPLVLMFIGLSMVRTKMETGTPLSIVMFIQLVVMQIIFTFGVLCIMHVVTPHFVVNGANLTVIVIMSILSSIAAPYMHV